MRSKGSDPLHVTSRLSGLGSTTVTRSVLPQVGLPVGALLSVPGGGFLAC